MSVADRMSGLIVGTSPVTSEIPRSDCPHSMQNFCPSPYSVPHAGHCMASEPTRGGVAEPAPRTRSTCNDPVVPGRPGPCARISRRCRRPARVTALGPDLLVVPFWTPRVLRRDRPGGRARRVRRRSATIPSPVTRCRSRRSARGCTRPSQDDLGRRIWPQLQDGLAAHRLPRAPRRLRHPLRPRRAGGAAEHHDVAQVSASVKLDDGYEGAELRFPRQGVDNRRVPVGALLAWPSLVTHPHEATPLGGA